MDRYNFKIIEKKWQDYWKDNNTFKAILDKSKKNSTVLKCFLTHLEKFTWGM